MTADKMMIKVCRFFNAGYCKYKSKCKFFHSKETCEDQCERKTCRKRHPKACKYRNKCKRKDTCEFNHSAKSNDMDLKDEVAVLRSLVEELQKECMHQKEKVETLQKDLKNVKEKLEPKTDKTKSPKKITHMVVPKKVPETDVESNVDKEPLNKRDKDQAEKVVMTDKEEIRKCRKCGKDFASKKELGAHYKSQHAEYMNDILEEKAHKEKHGCFSWQVKGAMAVKLKSADVC